MMTRNLLLGLGLALGFVALPQIAAADVIVQANEDFSIVKTESPSGDTQYLWRTKDGRQGTTATEKDARKAAKKALKEAKKAGK
jgi:hypothetical protein